MTAVPASSRVLADTPALMKPSAIPAADVIPSLTATAEAGASRPRASRRPFTQLPFTQLTRAIEPFVPRPRQRQNSDLDELDPRDVAEHAPVIGVVTQVHHLVVRAAVAEPPVQAFAHPGGRPELPVRHLPRRALGPGPGWRGNRKVAGSPSRPSPGAPCITSPGRSARATSSCPRPCGSA